MDMVTVDVKEESIYLVEVMSTARQVVDLLTRKREFKLVTTDLELSRMQVETLLGARTAWCEICDAREGGGADNAERRYLVVGDAVASRDAMRVTGPSADPELHAMVQESDGGYCTVEFLPVNDVYGLCDGKALRFSIMADTEDEANRIWLRRMLRLGEDPGKWYASDDLSSIKAVLSHVSGNGDSRADGEESPCGEPTPADIAEYDVYDRLRGKLESMARDYLYGDDVFVEYSISSDDGVSRYFATEFYSNHNWNSDPANLLVVRFCAEITAAEHAQDDARFSHPTKMTVRKADREHYLVESLVMANDVETKFTSGRGGEARPDTTVSADREMDNLVDFYMWAEMHRKEIELL